MFWVYQPAPVCVSTCPGIFENNPFWLVFSNAFISKLLNVFIDYFVREIKQMNDLLFDVNISTFGQLWDA